MIIFKDIKMHVSCTQTNYSSREIYYSIWTGINSDISKYLDECINLNKIIPSIIRQNRRDFEFDFKIESISYPTKQCKKYTLLAAISGDIK